MIASPRRLTRLLGWLILLFLVGGALAFVGALRASYNGLHEWLGPAWYWLVYRE